MAVGAFAIRLDLVKSTQLPQYGHVLVFWVAVASMKPLQFGHSTMDVRGILVRLSERLFHTRLDNGSGSAILVSGADKLKASQGLIDIARGYFKKEGFKLKGESVGIEGDSGVLHLFDLIVQKGRDEQVVWIRDWNRTIGVNVIIGLDTAAADVKMPNPIMIGEKFSDHAKSYSNRRKITLLTKQKLTTSFL